MKYIISISILITFLLVIGLASGFTCRRWQGGFRQAEYELCFLDKDGDPVRGMELIVEDETGGVAYYYPVTDFTPSNRIVTNADGVATFHHVSSKSPEFEGRTCWLFFVFALDEKKAPEYTCRFVVAGKERYHALFNVFNGIISNETNITRKITWEWPFFFPDNFPCHLRPENTPKTEELEFPVIRHTITIE